jgi:transcriptional regulator with XRE-family HTH domain
MITGDQVRLARRLLGWSQLDLALEACVSQVTVTNFETGRRRSAYTMSCIRRALEASGAEFSQWTVGLRAAQRRSPGRGLGTPLERGTIVNRCPERPTA